MMPEHPSPSWIDQRSKPPALMKTFFRPFTGLRVAALVAFSFFSVMNTPLAAAAAPVAALMRGLIDLPAGSRVAAVLSGGNLNLDALRGLAWN